MNNSNTPKNKVENNKMRHIAVRTHINPHDLDGLVFFLRQFLFPEYSGIDCDREIKKWEDVKRYFGKYLSDMLWAVGMEWKRIKKIVRCIESKIPILHEILWKDVLAAYDGDPAAETYCEIVLAYPGFYAIMIQRFANLLFQEQILFLPRILTEYAHSKTGIDIHPGAEIGEFFFIDHGTGVVIGETAIIGKCVKIYQGVTLGAISTSGGQKLRAIKRHPTVKDNVTIYAGASILGGDTVIGENSVIGSNVFITKSLTRNTKIYLDSKKYENYLVKERGLEDAAFD